MPCKYCDSEVIGVNSLCRDHLQELAFATLNQFELDGEPVNLVEFCEVNELHAEDILRVATLGLNCRTSFGGGAFADSIVTRVS